MNILKSAALVASFALAGPALADGGASFVYMPHLTYTAQDAAVSKDVVPASLKKPDTCTQLERGGDVTSDACGTLASSDLVKRKLSHDE
ncbi:hypothetical protein [Litoreibacter janthinus]|uniref:Uncharacterized protein n=1 Tax=Litoreibacter janthinus TaxID=670154 RepID=A0A1I6G0P5_9RHOB|nr:hypothetical protein [Litoreibacter janthinus]SFR35732.1 hypothetical protein SAMN04488002_0688 [Litoreibacter janthinus]